MAKSGTKSRWREVTGFLMGITVVLVAACGGDSGGGDEAQIEAVVRDFFAFTVQGKGNADKVYDLMDEESKGNCTKDEFIEQAEFTKSFFEGIGSEFKVKRIFDIKIDGDNATAKVEVTVDGELSDEGPEDTPFKKEGGKWRLSEAC